jgi:photosystem II stability/assembly factor-like uncharacterized protein
VRKSYKTFAFMLLAVAIVFFMSLLQLPLPGAAVERAAAASGDGWVDQTPVPDGPQLYAVDAVNGDVAWAVGVSGTIYNTTNGGDDWTQQDTGITNFLGAVAAVDVTTVWAGGGDTLLKTTDGGGTWVSQDAALTAFHTSSRILQKTISGLSVVDADTLWVSVNYILTGLAPFGYSYEAAIWKTDDAGATWARMLHTTVPPHVNEVYAVDDQVIWAAGGSSGWASPYPIIWVTTNGGATWSYRYLGFPGDISMVDVCARDGLNAWTVYAYVAGSNGGVKKTSDGGVNWMTQPTPAGVSPKALSGVGADTLWVVGSMGVIFKTIDGGATWIIQNSGVTSTLNDICAVDVDIAWAVGADGVILKTEDGGGGAPCIYNIQPTYGVEGISATITGYNFGDVQGSSYVSFGGVQATDYTSWSDTEIVVSVPAGTTGAVAVTVTTADGISNAVEFTAYPPLAVTSIAPVQGTQQTISLDITVVGTGFQPGATVRLESDAYTIGAVNLAITETQITGAVGLFGAQPGVYDVVVENPDGSEARLEDVFTVVSFCGAGSGTALLMLGLTLGLLSLAGSARLRRRKGQR